MCSLRSLSVLKNHQPLSFCLILSLIWGGGWGSHQKYVRPSHVPFMFLNPSLSELCFSVMLSAYIFFFQSCLSVSLVLLAPASSWLLNPFIEFLIIVIYFSFLEVIFSSFSYLLGHSLKFLVLCSYYKIAFYFLMNLRHKDWIKHNSWCMVTGVIVHSPLIWA